MSDDLNKEQSQEPQFKPDSSKSIWDVFDERRVNQPRDISDEVKKEMGGMEISDQNPSLPEYRDQMEEKLVESFKELLHKNQDKYGRLTMQNHDISISLSEVDRWGDLKPVVSSRPFEAASIDLMVATPEAKLKNQDELRTIKFNNQILPEYFLFNGGVMRAKTVYIMHFHKMRITKESFVREVVDIHSPQGLLISDQVDKEKLKETDASEDFKKKLLSGRVDTEEQELDSGDYEFLNSILLEAKNGNFNIVDKNS